MKTSRYLWAVAAFFLGTQAGFAAPAFPYKLPTTVTFYQDIYEYKYNSGRMRALYSLTPSQIPAAETKSEVCYWQNDNNTSEQPAATRAATAEQAEWTYDAQKARAFFLETIAPLVEREPESVRIFKNADGHVNFEGAANFGKKIDLDKAVALLQTALEQGVNRVELPIIKVPPQVTVDDPELRQQGIIELVSVGESNFSGSTSARIKNIEVGASKFTGFVIPRGEVASFNTQLGDVTGAQGYVPELVIQGPKLTKELGGGLCQVSSTAFRAALLAGLPIVERYAHSFAVHYYEPWGTDATIYPGHKDLRFENDTPGAILVQTTIDLPKKTLRFHFYGTKDKRTVKVIGPVSQQAMIESKGFSTRWYRLVQSSEQIAAGEKDRPQEMIYNFLSRYQPSTKWAVQKPAPTAAKEPEIVPTDAPPPAEAATAPDAPKAPGSGSSI